MDNIERDTQALLEDEEFNQNKNEVFLYLEQLRESGKTNMFGAVAFIQSDFECSFLIKYFEKKILRKEDDKHPNKFARRKNVKYSK